MITGSIAPESERELAALQGVLERYHDVSKRNVTETLARKANDIRIQLYVGYWKQRLRGPRKGAQRSEGIAFRQMRTRAREDEGIVLRRLVQQQGPSSGAPVEYFQRRKLRGAHGTARKLRVPVKMSPYQRRVWTELARRQAGIGVLGVAFLMQRYRKRTSTTQGGYVATGADRFRDNAGGSNGLQVFTRQSRATNETLGRLTLAPDFARIEGMVPGHAIVDNRYSILAIALRDVRTDTEKYLARKAEQSMKAELEAARINPF